ncbi:MAG: Calx-beta domain-containing protein, partial [Promethearchaeota archaeon]
MATSGTFTIPADSTSGTFVVNITDDALSEASESFKVLTVSDGLGVGTITDNDGVPSLSIDDVSTDEGADSLTFTVSLSAISGQDVNLDYNTTDGSAIAPDDYTATSATLTIPAGSPSGTIAVTIVDDALSESAETF